MFRNTKEDDDDDDDDEESGAPTEHVIARDTTRKYHCEYCDKSFKKSSHLKQHVRIHTGKLMVIAKSLEYIFKYFSSFVVFVFGVKARQSVFQTLVLSSELREKRKYRMVEKGFTQIAENAT